MDRQFIGALAWTGVAVAVAFLMVCTAQQIGFTVTFAGVAWLKVAGVEATLLLISVACRKVAPRSATAMTSFVFLSVAALATGTLSMTGQLLALPLIDPALATADHIFPIDAAGIIRNLIAIPGAIRVLFYAYCFSLWLMIFSAFALSLLGRFERVWELCGVSTFCLIVATVFSVFFPAIGSFSHLGLDQLYGSSLPLGSGVYHLDSFHILRSGAPLEIDPLNIQGLVTFPSFHTCMALIIAAAWRDCKFLRWPMAIYGGLVVVSTIPIGGHYLIDLAGGAFTWWIVSRNGVNWSNGLVGLLRTSSRLRVKRPIFT